MNMSVRSFQKAFSELEAQGYISRITNRDSKTGRFSGADYQLNNPPCTQKPTRGEPTRGEPSDGEPTRGFSRTINNTFDKELKNKKCINKDECASKKGSFETDVFWSDALRKTYGEELIPGNDHNSRGGSSC